jgi:hypothetical protein
MASQHASYMSYIVDVDSMTMGAFEVLETLQEAALGGKGSGERT